jgi:hypothetical protein
MATDSGRVLSALAPPGVSGTLCLWIDDCVGERTAQGYRRFRGTRCGKQFNERSSGVRNRVQYPSDVIALGCSGGCVTS